MVEPRLESEAQATHADVEAEAAAIWREVSRSGVDPRDTEGRRALLRRLANEHPLFNKSFPVVLRWMVTEDDFDAGVFGAYLRHIKAPVWKTREEFLESQADYVMMLAKRRMKHYDSGYIARYRAALIKSLREEDERFLAASEEARKQAAGLREEVKAARRARILAALARRAGSAPT